MLNSWVFVQLVRGQSIYNWFTNLQGHLFEAESWGTHGSSIQLFCGCAVDEEVDNGTEEAVEDGDEDAVEDEGVDDAVVVVVWGKASVAVWESELPLLFFFLSPTPKPTPRLTTIPMITWEK